RDQLAVGDVIDVYCVRTFTWYQSKVIESDEKRLKVHFKGWNHKFDEWVERSSQRIEPLGTHSNEVLCAPATHIHMHALHCGVVCSHCRLSDLWTQQAAATAVTDMVAWFDKPQLYDSVAHHLG